MASLSIQRTLPQSSVVPPTPQDQARHVGFLKAMASSVEWGLAHLRAGLSKADADVSALFFSLMEGLATRRMELATSQGEEGAELFGLRRDEEKGSNFQHTVLAMHYSEYGDKIKKTLMVQCLTKAFKTKSYRFGDETSQVHARLVDIPDPNEALLKMVNLNREGLTPENLDERVEENWKLAEERHPAVFEENQVSAYADLLEEVLVDRNDQPINLRKCAVKVGFIVARVMIKMGTEWVRGAEICSIYFPEASLEENILALEDPPKSKLPLFKYKKCYPLSPDKIIEMTKNTSAEELASLLHSIAVSQQVRSWMPVLLIHMEKKHIKNSLGWMGSALVKPILQSDCPSEVQTLLAKLSFSLSFTMPYHRGSASLQECVLTILALYRGFDFSFLPKVQLDLEAYRRGYLPHYVNTFLKMTSLRKKTNSERQELASSQSS